MLPTVVLHEIFAIMAAHRNPKNRLGTCLFYSAFIVAVDELRTGALGVADVSAHRTHTRSAMPFCRAVFLDVSVNFRAGIVGHCSKFRSCGLS